MMKIILGVLITIYSAFAIDSFGGVSIGQIPVNQVVTNTTKNTSSKSEEDGATLSFTLGAFLTNLDGISLTKTFVRSSNDLDVDNTTFSYRRVFPMRYFALTAGASYNMFTHSQTLSGSSWNKDKLEFTTSYYTLDFGLIADLPIPNTAIEFGYRMEISSDNKEGTATYANNNLVVKYEDFSEMYIGVLYLFGYTPKSVPTKTIEYYNVK